MKIEVEQLAPLADFKTLRNQLILAGEKFSEKVLPRVPYEQLILCCSGEAGAARCDRELVVKERKARRKRFLSMETDEAERSEIYLKINQMDEDVATDRALLAAPHWESLNAHQQVWLKLNCIYNHVDFPEARLKEAILLLRTCTLESCLPPDVVKNYMARLRGLLGLFPHRIPTTLFRAKISEIADNLFDFFPPEDAAVLQRETVRGYGCTSDCYRLIV